MKKFIHTRRLLSVLVISLSIWGCSNKEENNSSTQSQSIAAATHAKASLTLLSKPIIELLPETAVGYFVLDTNHPDYTAYLKKNAGSEGNGAAIQNALATAGNGNQELQDTFKLLTDLSDTLKDSGLLAKSPEQKGLITQLLAFVEFVPGSPVPSFTIYAQSTAESGEKGTSLKDGYDKLLATLQRQGIKADAKNYGTVPGHALISQSIKVPLASAQNGDKLILTSLPSNIEKILNTDLRKVSETSRSRIQNDSRLPQLTRTVSSANTSFMFGFIDIEKTAAFLKPAAIAAQIPSSVIEQLPLLAGAVTIGLNEQNVALLTDARTDSQKAVLATLDTAGKSASLETQPGDSLVSLKIATAPLSAVIDSLPQEATGLQASALKAKNIPILNKSSSATITLRGPSGPFPVPDFALSFETNEAQALSSEIKGLVSTTLSSQGLDNSVTWQKVTIAGVITDNANSPLGMGAYIGAKDKKVIIASSEKLFADLLQASGSTSLSNKIGQFPNAKLSSFFTAYVDFLGISKAVEQVQSSLALLTGGQNAVDNKSLDSLRALGSVFITASYQDKVIDVSVKSKT